MANFIKHTSCPRCGSRDNLAHYDDGSQWCFGCHYYLPPSHAPTGVKRSSKKLAVDADEYVQTLPEDIDGNFSDQAWEWLNLAGINGVDLARGRVVFSKKWNQIIFPFYDSEGHLLAWQGRNLTKGNRKYFTSGELNSLLPVYSTPNIRNDKTVVLVEDCISALKISRQFNSMPLLGSGVGLTKLNRVAALYSPLVLWLDSNMFHHSIKMARQVSIQGRSTAKVVFTKLDPKYYTDDEIKKYVESS